MQEFDVAIIGAGIVGACVFSELTRKGVKAVLLEAGSDVSNGSTKANSGLVHAGYDPEPNTLKAKFNIRGNQLYPAMCARLKVDILQCGTLVVAPESGRDGLNRLYERGLINGVQGMRIIEREELHTMEPNLADNIDIALFAPTGAVISPYLTCIALCEEGVINGGEVRVNFAVDKITQNADNYTIFAQNESVTAKFVVNCAGVGANDINALVGAPQVPLKYVKGAYLLLDKSQKDFVHHPIFPLPNELGKGVLATPTLHGNIMFGPNAIPCEPHDTSVDADNIAEIKQKVEMSVKSPNYRKVIKLFAGVRVVSGDDFVIERFGKTNFYYTAGICSPGLTSAPAIAEFLVNEMHANGLQFRQHEFVQRKPYTCTEKMSKKDLKELIKLNPSFGKIICRCEKITEGEIIEAIHSPLKPSDVDAIKRRVRPTMGRCQGGFCLPKVLKILANETGLSPKEITLKGAGSEIILDDLKNSK